MPLAGISLAVEEEDTDDKGDNETDVPMKNADTIVTTVENEMDLFIVFTLVLSSLDSEMQLSHHMHKTRREIGVVELT